jgi:signal transduction histidine kinase
MVRALLRGVRRALVVGGWLAAVVAAPATAQIPSLPDRVLLGSALSVESAAPTFAQVSEAGLRTVALPDVWERTRPHTRGPVWYRLRFEWPASAEAPERAAPSAVARALWIERACGAVDVHVNGVPLRQAGRSAAASTPLCNDPILLPVPDILLKPGVNLVDIRLDGRPLERVTQAQRAAMLSRVEFGPAGPLQARAARHARLHAALPLALGGALIIVGAFQFVLGLGERRNRYLAYLGGLGLTAGALTTLGGLPDLPVDARLLEVGVGLLWALATWMAVQFLLRHGGQRQPWADRLLPLQALLVPISLWLCGPDLTRTVMLGWTAVLTLEVAAAAGVHLLHRWAKRPRDAGLMLALLVVLVAAEAAGAWAWASTWPTGALIARTTAVLGLVLLMLRLTQQKARAQEVVEANRALLEQRVAEVKSEVETNYRQLAELRVVQVTERERKRIAADLHDDLGAKLLTIVHTSESERISTLAREALEEMRLSVRGLTGKPVRLEDALGDWRAEVISRLGQAGIEAVWNMPTEELTQTLPARTFVQTTRIIREAVNNIIKHSGASQCAVRCNVADGDFQLVIQDNGKGIAMELDGRLDRGHGLATMKGRAKQLQGQCLFESGPGYGTVVRLTIPLETSGQPA